MNGFRRLRCLAAALALCLLAGCAYQPAAPELTRYQATYLTLFDTVTTVLGYAETEEEFTEISQALHDEMLRYHQLFDIYNDYEGVNNLKTVNDQAGIAPVKVDPVLMALLKDCKAYYELTEGKVNVFMGSVLSLWHEARTEGIDNPEAAALPDPGALALAAEHCDPDDVILDEEAMTVYIADPMLRLDVGAIAKGWSTQQVCSHAPEGLLVSVGGNVFATGPKPTGESWVVGVQSPDDEGTYLHTLYTEAGSVVTSGDYQRYYMVDGERYHHIIDPDTLAPSRYWRAVTVICEDSGLADCLSTALFLLPRAEGQALLEKTGAEAIWVDAEGKEFCSPGFSDFVRT